MKASDVANFLEVPLIGPDVLVNEPRALQNPAENAMLFANRFSVETLEALNGLANVFVLAAPEYAGSLTVAHVVLHNPRMAFARVVQRFFAPPRRQGVAPTAWVSPTARLGENVSVGHYSVIGDDVVLGDNTEVRDHVVIENAVIGRDSLIKSNTVIGQEGFGFEFEENGTPIRIPHLGRVVIGDEVEIGALNCIARGTLEDTVLEDRVKTDDHVFIAHNVTVGENTVIIAGAEISGSVRIGKNVWIAPQATIINKVTVGDNALVGIGAVVTKSVEVNMIVAGNPAKVVRPRY